MEEIEEEGEASSQEEQEEEEEEEEAETQIKSPSLPEIPKRPGMPCTLRATVQSQGLLCSLNLCKLGLHVASLIFGILRKDDGEGQLSWRVDVLRFKAFFFFFVHCVLVVGQKNHLIAKMCYLINSPCQTNSVHFILYRRRPRRLIT